MDVTTVSKLLSKLPCPACGSMHEPDAPHDLYSRYHQREFEKAHGRPPTWQDALHHCSPRIVQQWLRELEAQWVLWQGG